MAFGARHGVAGLPRAEASRRVAYAQRRGPLGHIRLLRHAGRLERRDPQSGRRRRAARALPRARAAGSGRRPTLTLPRGADRGVRPPRRSAERDALAESLPSWPVFPEVPASLEEARDAGWRLAILSNTDRDLIEASKAQLGVPFERDDRRAEIGSYKPAPGHWRAVRGAHRRRPARRPRRGLATSTTSSRRRSSGSRTCGSTGSASRHEPPPTRELPDLTGLAGRPRRARGTQLRGRSTGSKIGRLMSGHIDVSVEQKSAPPAEDGKRHPNTCPSCGSHYRDDELAASLFVCAQCGHHFPVPARARVARLADPGTFVEEAADVRSEDPLAFFDLRPYTERLAEAELNTGLGDAMVIGQRGDRRQPVRARRDGLRASWAARWAAPSARSSPERATARSSTASRSSPSRLGRRPHAGGDPLADAASEDRRGGRGPPRRRESGSCRCSPTRRPAACSRASPVSAT